ncbi:MAG: L-histidine N(alpha)-methyltransferase [Candidatus Krumholzibacteriales bacterium]
MQKICYGERTQIRNLLAGNRKEQYLRDILEGLTARNKYISSIFFYDEAGSRLFEKITSLPEYYPYNTEKEILREIAPELCKSFEGIDVVEIGSGDCSKISILLNAIPKQRRKTIRYVPVDISYSALRDSADIISERFPRIEFSGLVADFISQMDRIPRADGRFFCFFGSTIGNLSRRGALSYLTGLHEVMAPGDNLLLGVDMVKDIKIIERAYNDSEGVTAEFNRNILKVINSLAGTDFDPEAFSHVAFFNGEHSRIEMHLEARKDMEVKTPYLKENILIRKGERIHTENSHKFSREQIEVMLRSAGLTIKKLYTDPNRWFLLILAGRD